MSEQPKALALADALDKNWEHQSDLDAQAAAELRRLHAVNAQMLEALCNAETALELAGEDYVHFSATITASLLEIGAAIAAATGAAS